MVSLTRRALLAWGAAALALAGPVRPEARAQDKPARQITLFGVVAVPGTAAIDPKLAAIAPHLRRLLPDHGFRLLNVASQRLEPGHSLSCDLSDGWIAHTQLIDPLDPNGKIQLRFALDRDGRHQFITGITTPPNQLAFCEKTLPDRSRLLIGIGAR
jgi:hypothetical protein